VYIFTKPNKTTHTLYVITSSTGRKYYGITKSIFDRRHAHVRDLRIGRHPNKELQADYNAGATITIKAKKSSLTLSDARRMENRLIRTDPTCYNQKGRCGWMPVSHLRHNPRGPNGRMLPMLSPSDVLTVKNLLTVMYGYQVAQQLGISPSIVSKINTGQYPVKAEPNHGSQRQ